MKLILEIRKHSDDEQALHLAFKKFPVTVGRGFDNDVILTDPYVSPLHLRIDYDGETCKVSDPGSDNGFTVNALPHPKRVAHVRPGDILRIGQTEIGIYTPGYPVAATLRLQKGHPIFAWLSRSLNVWASVLLALAVTLCWTFLQIWTDEPGLSLAAAAAGTALLIVLWAAAWSVAGRLTRHKAHFKSHAAMMCLYMIAGTVAWYIEAYADFLTNENWLSGGISYGLNFILLSFLLYGSLTLATLMPQRRRQLAAVFFSFGLVGGVFIFSLVGAKSFNQAPMYPATLEPFLSQLAPADTPEQFMAGNKDLFASDEFDRPADKKSAMPKP